jgi:hypothetical protein
MQEEQEPWFYFYMAGVTQRGCRIIISRLDPLGLDDGDHSLFGARARAYRHGCKHLSMN